MFQSPGPGRLVAICGVDGVGKTTLISRLSRETSLLGASTLTKTDKTAFNAVQKLSGSEHGGWKAWNEGSFAEAIAIAASIDFLNHYSKNILPAIEANNVVITDRYHLCYAAYLACVKSRVNPQLLFQRIMLPDLIIILDALPESIASRLARRGGATDDENPELSAKLRLAYRQLAPSFSKRYTIINADIDADAVYAQAIREIESIF